MIKIFISIYTYDTIKDNTVYIYVRIKILNTIFLLYSISLLNIKIDRHLHIYP